MNAKRLLRSSGVATAIALSCSLCFSVAAKPERADNGMPRNISSEPLPGDYSRIVNKRSSKQKTKLKGTVTTTDGGAAKRELNGSTSKDRDKVKLLTQKAKGLNEDLNVNEQPFQSRNPESQKVNEGDGNNNQNGINVNGGKNEPDGSNNQSESNN